MTYAFLTDRRRACRDVDPDTFYPPPHNPARAIAVEAARAVCDTCPFTAECLQYALDIDDRFGVFAGLTAVERARGRGVKLRTPAPNKASVAARRTKVVAMTADGVSAADIAVALGTTRDVVIADRRRVRQGKQVNRWLDLHRRIDELEEAGVGPMRIARTLSIDRSTVYRRRAVRAEQTATLQGVAA